jgi:hypothetical protein
MRTFEVFNCGRFLGKVRAVNPVNAFKNAQKKWPYLSTGEMELQDPNVQRRGHVAYNKAA